MFCACTETGLKAFDAMIHFSFEGSFLYLSTFGRSVNASQGPFAELCTSVLSSFHTLCFFT